MFRKIRNLRLVYKLALVAAVMCAPVIVFAVFFIQTANENIQKTRREQTGLEFLASGQKLWQHIARHRELSVVNLDDGTLRDGVIPAQKQEAEALDAQIAADLADVQKKDDASGWMFDTTSQLHRIKDRWQAIQRDTSRMTTKELLDAHTAVIADVMELIRRVGEPSAAEDGHYDTFAIIYASTILLTSTGDYIGQLNFLGSAVLLNKSITDADRAQLNAVIGATRRFTAKGGRIEVSFHTAIKQNPALERKLSGPLNDTVETAGQFLQATQDKLAKKEIGTSLQEHFARATRANAALYKLIEAVSSAANDELGQRIAEANSTLQEQLGIAVLALVAAIFMVTLVSRGISRQVSSMTKMFGAIGIGDFSARAAVLSEDDLGHLTVSLNAMLDSTMGLIQSREERDRIQESIRKLLEEIGGLAQGDLTVKAEVTAEITGALADSFNYMIEELRKVISSVQHTTLTVSASADEVNRATEALAEGSESQSLQIVEASAAIDQMAVSIQQVSENAASAAGVAETASKSAQEGASTVQKTIEGMNGIRQQVQQTAKRIKRLGESSQEIGEIVQLINDIADRTSILALNASIQAAMAGDAGKGFGVVAGEVERLADRSTEATKKISGLIKSIQADTNEAISAMEETTREVVSGSALANEAGQKLTEIEKVSHKLAQLIQSISMASKQQSRGSEAMSKSMADISQVTQQGAAGAKQTAVSIRHLAQMADTLRSSLDRFKLPAGA